ncbi:MAG: alkaline phosphatase family protein [Candidatus Helarchaeota archaeon]
MKNKIKKTKTLIFFLDAVREDYITKRYTPFLYKLKNENTFLNLISFLGYSSGIHPSIWSGKYQEELGKFLVYSYDENSKHFAWMRNLRIFPQKFRQYFIGFLKIPYYMTFFPNWLLSKWYKKSILPIPASMDPLMAKYFKIEDKMFRNDFLKILKDNRITYTVQSDRDNPNYSKKTEWYLSNKDLDLFFSWYVDILGHYPGPKSKELHSKMKDYDKKITKIYDKAVKKYDKVNIFVFSDHGMEEVIGTINVKSILDKSDLVPVKDYISFYDSTMVRFWVKSEKIKKQIVNLLSDVNHLTYLDQKLKNKYHINFKDRKWGDLFFLADNGYRIFPDYFSPVRFNTKGMHGYFPEKNNNAKGIFISNAFKTQKKEIKIVEMLPTFLKTLKLTNKIPKCCKGKPIY